MTLRDRLEDDIREAMRQRSQARLDALRFLKFAVQAVEKDAWPSRGQALDDQAMVEVVAKQVNDRRESIRAFEQGSRNDLVVKEEADLSVLEEYLPPQLTGEEIAELVSGVINEVGAAGPRDKGKVMGKLMPQVRGKADGAEVNRLVTGLLESLG